MEGTKMSLKKDSYFMALTMVTAQQGTCKRRKVGAIFVNDDYEILTSGYNGSPRGFPHCDDDECLVRNNQCIATVHAEQNAIVQAAKRGVSLNHSTLFVSIFPCFNCIKLLITLGVKRIVYNEEYESDNHDMCLKYIENSHILVQRFDDLKSRDLFDEFAPDYY
jgi:dCMP deaminase